MTAVFSLRLFCIASLFITFIPATASLMAQSDESTLLEASRNGETGTVRELLEAGTDPNATRDDGWTPLMLAAMNGNEEIIDLLLSHKADPNKGETEYGTAVATAAVTPVVEEKVSLQILRKLLDGGADVDSQNGVGMTPLFYAAREGKPEVVKMLVKSGANINHQDVRNWTPLFMAIISEDAEIVSYLLREGANPHTKNWETRRTLLHHAVNQGVLETVRLLLEAGVDPDGDFGGEYPPSPLMQSAAENYQPIVELLLEYGANPNYNDRGYLSEDETPRTVLDWTRFHNNRTLEQATTEAGGISYEELAQRYQTLVHAVENGDHKTFAKIVETGIDPRMPLPGDDDYMTLFNLAVEKGQTKILAMILAYEKPVGPWEIFEAWQTAEAAGNQEILDLLTEQRANDLAWLAIENSMDELFAQILQKTRTPFEYRGYDDFTLLHLAADLGATTPVKLLLEAGMSPHVTNRWEETPLYNAVRIDFLENVELLLEAGCKLDHRNHNGLTPLHAAARAGSDDVVHLLVERGADINARDDDGWTPLHSAAWLGYDMTVQTLLNDGADRTILTNRGQTAEDIARQRGEIAVENILKSQ